MSEKNKLKISSTDSKELNRSNQSEDSDQSKVESSGQSEGPKQPKVLSQSKEGGSDQSEGPKQSEGSEQSKVESSGQSEGPKQPKFLSQSKEGGSSRSEVANSLYLLTGGGTGGHVYPALAIADAIREFEPDAQFVYVGVKGKAESKIVPSKGIPLLYVTSYPWPGFRNPKILLFALMLFWGIIKSIYILLKFKPRAIIATGGYVAAPVMFAWIILKKLKLSDAKTFVHEQNYSPGKLNKLVGKIADTVGITFPQTKKYFPNSLYLGYPLRKSIGSPSREEARKKLDIPQDAKVMLVFGGSQGARSINRSVVRALSDILEKFPNLWILHGVGLFDTEYYHAWNDTTRLLSEMNIPDELLRRYRAEPYLHQIEYYYSAADFALCRAGAGTISELACASLPAILVPKANLPGDHQVKNARALAQEDAAVLLFERSRKEGGEIVQFIPKDRLLETISKIISDDNYRKTLGKNIRKFCYRDSAAKIAQVILSLVSGAGGKVLSSLELSYSSGDSSQLDLTDFSGPRLVSYFQRNGSEDLSPQELEYLIYRTEDYLASERWQSRNIGVKLVGLLNLKEHLDSLLFILSDPRPAPLLHRLLGGDRFQVGFIRRNAVLAIRQLNIWNTEVRNALYSALSDPYFEVRTYAADAIRHFARSHPMDPEIEFALMKLSRHSNFENRCAAYRALAEITKSPEIYRQLKSEFFNPNWKVREAVLTAIERLIQRKVLEPQEVRGDLEQFLLTSTGFSPVFSIRQTLKRLSDTIKASLSEGESE